MEKKIKVEGKIVEMNGDGMSRVLFKEVKDELITRYL
jgi:isocitrate dehydrogenase